jgi:uncharacterized protein YjiS (DUF1127 family)
MTTQTLNTPVFVPRLAGSVTAFFVGLANAFAFASGAQARFDEIQHLQALSDDELARLGIARDAIVRHVYGDLLTQ